MSSLAFADPLSMDLFADPADPVAANPFAKALLMPSLQDLRILVVASSPLARAGLTALLEHRADLNVVGQTAGDAELLETIDVYRPDVVLWELGWEPAQMVERVAETRAARVPVLVLLSEVTSAINVTPALMAAGARGLLLQTSSLDRLTAALNAVAQGLVVIDDRIAASLQEDLRTEREYEATRETLTPREREVLALIAEGLPNKAIALRLGISEHTVKFHVNAILTKFGAQSRTEAVVRATRAGLLSL